MNRRGQAPARPEDFSPLAPLQRTNLPNLPQDGGEAAATRARFLARMSAGLLDLADQARRVEREDTEAARQAGVAAAESYGAAGAPAAPAGGGKATVSAAAGGAAAPATRSAREARAIEILREEGWSDHAAAAITATFARESSLDTRAVNPRDGRDGSDSIGMGQWNGPRAEALKRFAAARGAAHDDFETQVRFASAELQGRAPGSDESRWGQALKAATDARGAARAAIGWMRPAGWTAANPEAGSQWRGRLEATERLLAGGARASAEPLALRRDGTPAGQAYNEALRRGVAARSQADIRLEVDEIARRNEADPDRLNAELAAAQEKRLAGLPEDLREDPDTRAALAAAYRNLGTAGVLSARAERERRAVSAEKAERDKAFEAAGLGIERAAYQLGANPEGDRVLAELTRRAHADIDLAVRDGDLDAATAERRKAALAGTATVARIRGTFDALPDAEAKRRFADGLQEKWKADDPLLKGLTLGESRQLITQMQGEARRLAAETGAASELERLRVQRLAEDDVASVLSTGRGVPAMTPEVARRTLGETGAQRWAERRERASAIHRETADLAVLPPDAMRARLEALTPKAGEEGFKERSEVQREVARRMQAVMKAREDDPATAAALAFPQVKEAVAAFDPGRPESLATLATAQLDAQATLGIAAADRRVLTAEQARVIGQEMAKGPEQAARWAMAFTAMKGDAARRALAQVAEDRPGLALAADFATRTGDMRGLTLLAAQQQWEKEGGKPPARKPAREDALARQAIGRTFAALPEAEASVRDNAWAIHKGLARERGLDPDIATPAGERLYREALQLASGGRTVNGKQVGGIQDVNGAPTLVPPGLTAAELERRLERLTDERLKAMPPIRSGNGLAITARQIRNGVLVADGPGRYRVQLGRTGTDPRYVMGADGRPWTLDLDRLTP